MSFVLAAVDYYDNLTDLLSDLSEWSQATFGSDAERGPIGPLKHLALEAKEAQEAVGKPELITELADCFLLLMDATRKAGKRPIELIRAAQAKMEVNRQRTWNKPVKDEAVLHKEQTNDQN